MINVTTDGEIEKGKKIEDEEKEKKKRGSIGKKKMKKK
jgi:hypothetical protein